MQNTALYRLLWRNLTLSQPDKVQGKKELNNHWCWSDIAAVSTPSYSPIFPRHWTVNKKMFYANRSTLPLFWINQAQRYTVISFLCFLYIYIFVGFFATSEKWDHQHTQRGGAIQHPFILHGEGRGKRFPWRFVLSFKELTETCFRRSN